MTKKKHLLPTFVLLFSFIVCTGQSVTFKKEQLEVLNREIELLDETENSVALNRVKGDGMAIIKNLDFDKGIIEVDLKGENVRGKSFVGIAFNIQNDSVYEAIYFRPFNFRAEQELNRDHSVQYIYHPKHSWRYLRTNHEGEFESNYPRQPDPDQWFGVRIEIDKKKVIVYDRETNTELLSVKRLTKQVEDRIGLWAGFDSKGAYRNLTIK